MNEVVLRPYAKINLTLDVLGKRDDGYHDIDSVVQIIDLSEKMLMSKAELGVVEVETESREVPSGEENIVYKACNEFMRFTGLKAGVRCIINKHIPVQAGLGGGSSDAAAAIMGLNYLFDCGLDKSELSKIAAQVGSDAALFIFGGTIRMRGRGDIVSELPNAPEMHVVIAKPSIGVSTAWAYNELDKSGFRKYFVASDLAEEAVRQQNINMLIDSMSNDFELPVMRRYEVIRRAKEMLLENGAKSALLAGSGSAVFGVFESRKNAENAAGQMETAGYQAFVAKTLSREESAQVVL